MTDVLVKIFRCNKEANLPAYGTGGAVGIDLQTMVDIDLEFSQTTRIPTGIVLGLPDNYEAVLRPRSSTSGKGLVIHLGTVDPDYRGEVVLNVTCISGRGFFAMHGDRIAQMVIGPICRVKLEEVKSLAELGTTARGDKGFGSTGR